MPRNLPWNRQRSAEAEPVLDASVCATSQPASSAAAPGPTPRLRPSAPSWGSASAPRNAKAGRAIPSLRSPSTSPPPPPLSETFMVEGLDDDDRFRMVEDELLYIAGKFTAHLHAAEYHRQKQQAKARNADTIDTISRPVVGRMTPGVRAKQDRLEKTRKRRDGVRKALAHRMIKDIDPQGEDDSPWMGTGLQGLMEAPQSSVIQLSRLPSSGYSTKASAGLDRARGQLGVSTRPTATGKAKQSTAKEIANGENHDLDIPTRRSALLISPSSRPTTSMSANRQHPDRPTAPVSSCLQRESTSPDRFEGSKTKTPLPVNRKDEASIVPLLSDSDDDLFASIRRRRQGRRASKKASCRGITRSLPPSATATSDTAAAQERDDKPETPEDIIPFFL